MKLLMLSILMVSGCSSPDHRPIQNYFEYVKEIKQNSKPGVLRYRCSIPDMYCRLGVFNERFQ